MEYNFREIEPKWQKYWVEHQTYKVVENKDKEKFYVLNMFPYPSGAGLHVGHPLGYIASDIYARYKRLQGFNVLNPMGYDAYGLPAEQYAIQTGQHPAVTTAANINRYREQLDKIGFCFDWDREVRTCDPAYYHWTQWAFQKMFDSYYCNDRQQARPIEELIKAFDKNGTEGLNVACSEELRFTADKWKAMDEKKQQETLMNYRIAYLGETMVNWCPKLGTVLANDEVVDGVSERGGYPVVQKKMRQWCLRVSAYAQRLLDGLDTVEWTDSLKETQRNWIGRSEGTEVQFKIKDSDKEFTIFTTRADTHVRRHVHGIGSRKRMGTGSYDRSPKGRSGSLSRCHQKTYGTRTHRRPPRNRRVLGFVCRQPFHGRKHPHLDKRLRVGRLRDRSHHGRTGT